MWTVTPWHIDDAAPEGHALAIFRGPITTAALRTLIGDPFRDED